MAINKIFLGTSKPLAELAAARLLKGAGKLPDLGRILIAVPGNHARTQLQNALVKLAPNGLLEPQIITPGVLMHCGAPEANIPDQLENELIWNNVAEEAAKSGEFDLLFPVYNENISVSGTQFNRLRLELAAGGFSIADAAEHLGSRSEQLYQIEQLYLAELKKLGFTDRLAADLAAVEDIDFFKDFDKVILCGIADVPILLKKRIQKIADTWENKVEAWICADSDKDGFFDFCGSAIPEKWNNVAMDIPDFEKHVHCVETVSDAADKLIDLISQSGEFVFDDTAIVLSDPSMFPEFKRKLTEWTGKHNCKIDLYDPSGISFSELRLHKLGCALLNFCKNDDDIESAMALIKNQDMLDYLAVKLHNNSNYLLRKLDDFMLDVLPIERQNATAYFEDNTTKHKLAAEIFKLLEDIIEKYKSQEPAEFIRDFFTDIYRHNRNIDNTLFRGVAFTAECRLVQDSLRKLENSTASSLRDKKQLLEIFWKQLGNEKLSYIPGENPLTVEGCLELPFLSEKNIYFCGVNAEYFPDRIKPTMYLTDTIRKKCGIRSNQDTFARAAAHLHSLCSPSEYGRNMQMIAMKLNSEGSPISPSPLFFTGNLCEKELVLRSRVFFRKFSNTGKLPQKNTTGYSAFTLTPVLDHRTHPDYPDVPVMNVTAFKSYLYNPLDYFLDSVIKMEETDYLSKEPDSKIFGTIVHAVIERLGTQIYHSADDYNARLQQLLNEVIREQYGKNPSPLIEVARENISQRLKYVAPKLFDCSRQDFIPLEIEYVLGGEEKMVPLYLSSNKKPDVFIKGKIDRIEYSPQRNLLRIIDFKTGKKESVRNTVNSLLAGKNAPKLSDIQMPLYAELLRNDKNFMDKLLKKYPAAKDADICCAYISLPEHVTDTEIFEVNSSDLSKIIPSALDLVENIIKEIKLWKNQEMSPKGLASQAHKNLFHPDIESALPYIHWTTSKSEEKTSDE